MIYKLEQPDLSKVSQDEILKAFNGEQGDDVFKFVKKSTGSEYLYWDKLRHKEPSPEGISKEALWKFIKVIRGSQSINTVIRDKDGKFFTWSKLDYFEEFFHNLDMETGGGLFVEKGGVKKADKQKLISRGVMEEAIASSQLEGAATSRKVAKKMLREKRKPVNESEQMILNGHTAMLAIEGGYSDEVMSLDLILELHAILTKDTKDTQGEKPRLRKNNEPVCVTDDSGEIIYHEAPSGKFVKKELERLVKFANDELGCEAYMHPAVKAIMIHFWIGYLHPFTDGNGRLARLLFFWYLVKRDYWVFRFLPISTVIKKSQRQYIMAYVYSEQDNNDMTYFLDYNLKKIKLAVKDFTDYVKEQSLANIQMNKKCSIKYSLNQRQVQLLQFFYGNLDERTTMATHMEINQISKKTASVDLKDLVRKKFLISTKQGRRVYYYGTKKIKELF